MAAMIDYLLVGLGNPGNAYMNTRHNLGFRVIERIAKNLALSFVKVGYAEHALVSLEGKRLHLLRPATYVNRSGVAVAYWMNKLSLAHERLLVISDDLHLPLGKLRMRSQGGDGGHNGLRNISEALGSCLYPRLRIGIGNHFLEGSQAAYVLGKFSLNEMEILARVIPEAIARASTFFNLNLKVK